MNRLFAATGILIFALGAAHAGTIVEVGQTSGSNNFGLTNTYITTALNNGTKTGFVEQNYSTILFHNASVSAPPTATNTTPTYVSDPANGGVTFALLGDNSGGTVNGWENNSVSSNTLTVPINAYGVDTLWTMLNENYGDLTHPNSVSLTFYFNTSDTMTGASSETVTLVDGQEIRASTLCNTATPASCPSSQPIAFNHPTNTPTATESGVLATLSSISVTTGQVQYPSGTTYNPSYSTAISGSGQDNGNVGGSVVLDDQQFSFGSTFASDYLVAMTITDVNSPTDTLDHIMLSAVSVDATPEPSTFVLLLAGVAIFGYSQRRMRKV